MFVLAHLSDLHATSVRLGLRTWPALAGKRGLGWLSWRARRRHEHRPEVLAALADDLAAVGADHVAVTGDLTHLSLPGEFPEAVRWLERLGGAERVSLVPGNHDAYVRLRGSPWEPWRPYLASDPGRDTEPWPTPAAWRADPRGGFPTFRERGPLALIGLCSAHPTPPFDASGSLGSRQLAALEKRLVEARDAGLARVVLVHHPPTAVDPRPRRRLRDGAALCRVVARTGAELVLHGHTHRTTLDAIPGPDGPIPVSGVRSASAAGRRPGRRARYHLYTFAPPTSAHPRWRITAEARGLDPATPRFTPLGPLTL